MNDLKSGSNVPGRFEETDSRSPFQRSVLAAWLDIGGVRRGAALVDALLALKEKEGHLADAIDRRDEALIRANKTRYRLNNMQPLYNAIDVENAAALKKAQNESELQQLEHDLKKEKLHNKLDKKRAERTRRERQQKYAKMRVDYIQACGGYDKMTEEQKADLKKGDQAYEEFMRASGLA
jgi:hypothetical protein